MMRRKKIRACSLPLLSMGYPDGKTGHSIVLRCNPRLIWYLRKGLIACREIEAESLDGQKRTCEQVNDMIPALRAAQIHMHSRFANDGPSK